MTCYDVIILGAGASGLMCAIEAGKREKAVLILDHADKVGKKIVLSGGGRCNFTNLHISPNEYISQNRYFCISALKRFTQHDIISFIQKHGIEHHEREHGRLFTSRSAQDIVNVLLKECNKHKVNIIKECGTLNVKKNGTFNVHSGKGTYSSESLVIATGGMSFQKKSGLGFGYNIARQFSLNVVEPYAGLVPFTYNRDDAKCFSSLPGIFVNAAVTYRENSFRENILFTHRGLSGPAILQISSYWNQGEAINIDLLPDQDLFSHLKQKRDKKPKAGIISIVSEMLPKRLVEKICENSVNTKPIRQFSDKELKDVSEMFKNRSFKPNGTEGYRTAEVTVGGVNTNELSSKTLESKNVKGLYFIGEVVDVTGHLGGYNLQWAWSSGFCAGQFV